MTDYKQSLDQYMIDENLDKYIGKLIYKVDVDTKQVIKIKILNVYLDSEGVTQVELNTPDLSYRHREPFKYDLNLLFDNENIAIEYLRLSLPPVRIPCNPQELIKRVDKYVFYRSSDEELTRKLWIKQYIYAGEMLQYLKVWDEQSGDEFYIQLPAILFDHEEDVYR